MNALQPISEHLPAVGGGDRATDSPFLSVVVIHHQRFQYLLSAIDSAVRQSLPRNQYEVVSVGPEPLASIREGLRALDVHSIVSAGEGIGEKIADALPSLGGKVVTFLEDDDRYLPERLKTVFDNFQKNPQLGYFQNCVRPIDSDGHDYPGRFVHRRELERWARSQTREFGSRPVSSGLAKLRGLPAGFNNSSIAIRKELLDAHGGELAKIGLLADGYLLYVGLASGLDLRFDPTPLTQFRVHALSTSNPSPEATPTDLTGLRNFLSVTQPARAEFLRVVGGWGIPELTRAAEGQLWSETLIYRLRDPDSTRADLGRATLQSAARWDTFEVRSRGGAVPLGFAACLSPRLGHRIYRDTRGWAT